MTQPLNILMVEDSPNDADLILQNLQGAGIDAYTERVETAGEFDAALARRSWDIVLSDFALPVFSGLEALQSLRARGLDIPFLLISGTVGEEIAVEAIRSGADDYLLKDRLQRLASAVQRALERASDRRRRTQVEAELRESREQFFRAQKMEGIGRLAGGVAHDFNNLLTVITGYGQLALSQVPPDHPLRPPLGEVMRAAERAATLTRQLLAFSRRQVLQPTVLDLNAVVTDVQSMLSRLIGEDVAVRTALASGLGRVRADAGQIEQVIMNLAVNARDAMPKGGVLSIETSDVRLDEAYAREHVPAIPGPYVLLAVSDNGVGMDEETKAKIFEPFFTTKEPGKGTGLGLSTVYGIVKQSGGYIWVYSEPGRGTTFKIYLPRVESPLSQSPSASALRDPVEGQGTGRSLNQRSTPPGGVVDHGSGRSTETILLVEDDDAIRRLTSMVLREGGYKVVEASGGEEALSRSQGPAGTIHLLITDLVMPRMDARDMAARLSKARPGLRVLFMSGYAEHAAVHQNVLDPGVPFLSKPFTPDGLLRKVREVLDGKS